MLANILVSTLGVFIYLFLFWKKLKEDYDPESIFSTSLFSIIAGYIGLLISKRFLPISPFHFFFLFSGIGLILTAKKYKLRFFEIFEIFIFAALPLYSLLFLKDAVVANSTSSLVGFLAVMMMVGLFMVIDGKYKTFSWYKSGKVGFTGLFVAGALFFFRALISTFFENVFSLAGSGETIISAAFSFVMFLLLFNLSRNT